MNVLIGFLRVFLLTSCFKCAALGQSREPTRTSAFPGKERKSRQSQTAATSGTCRFVGCLMRFFSLTKRELPLVNSHAKNFRIFWDRDCLQLPWRAQPASFSRSSGGARGGFTISPLGYLHGDLTPRAVALVIEWAAQHLPELESCWKLAREMQPIPKISPLE